MPRVAAWPMREGFLAYAELLKRRAREAYYDDLLLYVIQRGPITEPGRPPDRPAILRSPMAVPVAAPGAVPDPRS